MMDCTDRHDRVFLRQFSKHTLLYTEMVTSAALEHGDANYLLQHSLSEHPVALQIGGCNPDELARGALLGEQAGFDEINLNVGCPSDRVKSGSFGASLMAKPKLVAKCVAAMNKAVSIPVTVKSRIGIDDKDSETELIEFIETIAATNCSTFIIHARKAILNGLSPKENREVPPLDYSRVFSIKEKFPELEIIINGGIKDLKIAKNFLNKVDGVMLGREAYQNPYILHEVDQEFYDECIKDKSRIEYLMDYLPYVEKELNQGTPLKHISRHLFGLFKGQRGGKKFRRYLSENSHRPNAGIDVLKNAISLLI